MNNITKEWSTSQAGLLSVPNASVTPRRPSVEGTSILPTVLERAKDPKTVRTNGLPGFQNTFQDETSLPTSQTRAYTRKCNRNDASLSAKAISPTSPYPLNQPWSNVNASPSMRMDVSETEGLHLAAVTDDIHMIEAEEVAEPDTQTAKVAYSDDNANTGDDFKFTDPLNQKAEVFLPVRYSSKVLIRDPARQDHLITLLTFIHEPDNPYYTRSPARWGCVSRVLEYVLGIMRKHTRSRCQHFFSGHGVFNRPRIRSFRHDDPDIEGCPFGESPLFYVHYLFSHRTKIVRNVNSLVQLTHRVGLFLPSLCLLHVVTKT